MVTIHHIVYPKYKTGSEGSPHSYQEKCVQCHKNLGNINKFVNTKECVVTIRTIKKQLERVNNMQQEISDIQNSLALLDILNERLSLFVAKISKAGSVKVYASPMSVSSLLCLQVEPEERLICLKGSYTCLVQRLVCAQLTLICLEVSLNSILVYLVVTVLCASLFLLLSTKRC